MACRSSDGGAALASFGKADSSDVHTPPMTSNTVLTLSCPDRPGIVARVSGFFAEQAFNIEESSQFEDPETGQFFLRTEFSCPDCDEEALVQLQRDFALVADEFDMVWQLRRLDQPLRVVLAVSKWGHCFNGLLHKWRAGTLPVDIVAVVSNHEDMRGMSEWYGVPYHYLPVSNDNRSEQESQVLSVMEDSGAELLVLARYMQILSDGLCDQLAGRAINIHHSFLPGFKGARPYHQAYERGVKLIGATAHYVTGDLDEGPIIEQAVERVSHANSPEELVEIGRDIETVVLARAVTWHAQHRVLLNGNRTVVFRR
jgi:formyltetrahydrofolate deformylase